MSQNSNAIHAIIIVAMMFTALSLGCAVWVGRRARHTSADPFSVPFGEMPFFTTEQLARLTPRVDPNDPLRRAFAVRDRLKREAQPLLLFRQTDSAGLALRPRNADGGRSVFPSWLAAIRNFWKALRHA